MKVALHVLMKAASVAVVLMLLVPGMALAQGNLNARFALHAKDFFVASKEISNLCNDPSDPSVANYSPNWDGVNCLDYNVTRPTNEFPGPHVFLVVGQADGVGLAGASCGITYNPGLGGGNGIDPSFVSWTACADGLAFPNDGGNGDFPAPDGGLRITWSSCQSEVIGGVGVHAVLGVIYIYAYSEDVLQLTPNNNLLSGPELAVTACGGGTTNFLEIIAPSLLPQAMGRVHFGGDGSQGYTPCGVIPVRETTWGQIKNLYKEDKD